MATYVSSPSDMMIEKEGGMPGDLYYFIETHIFPKLE